MNTPCASKSRRVRFVAIVSVMLATGMMGAALAAGVDLDPAPPDLGASVAPNILMTFDDSGSMSRAYMPDTVGLANRFDGAITNAAAGAFTIHHRQFYFSGINTVYYNPAITYQPPLMPDGVTRFPPAVYTDAWRDGICANVPADGSLGPRCATPVKVNLSTDFYKGFDSFRCANRNGAGTCTQWDDAGSTSNERGMRDIPVAPRTDGNQAVIGGFYHVRSGSGATLTLTLVRVGTGAAERQNFANWYSYYRTRSLLARSGIASAFAIMDDKIRVAWQNLILNPISDTTAIAAFGGTQRTNFFKWAYTMQVGSGTPNRTALVRGGDFFSSKYRNGAGTGANGRFNPYWEDLPGYPGGGMELSCRQNFHLLVTDGYWNADAPAAVPAATMVDKTFELPDGRIYNNERTAPHTNVYRRETRTAPAGYTGAGDAAPSLADLAFHYWNTDLKPNLANKVPPYIANTTIGVTNTATRPVPIDPIQDDEIYFNPANDPASWQHVVQYTVGLGVSGSLPGADQSQVDATVRTLRQGNTLAWPVPNIAAEDARRIDDTFHAAVNGRGNYLSVSNPQQLIDGISSVLKAVATDRQGGTAIATTSSVVQTDGGEAFGTRFNTSGWAGSLIKIGISANNSAAATASWEAGARLTSAIQPNNRLLFTSSSGNRSQGISFRYGSLSAAQTAVLNKDPASGVGGATTRENPALWTVDNLGAQRVDYLRGVRTAESAAPNFRLRRSLLGAIIESQPIYVSSPGGREGSYPAGSPEGGSDSYETFVLANRARAPTVYVGSNDGMLHAFDARNGNERWAFVPGTLIENGRMTRMTEAKTDLVPGADDIPVHGDVYFQGANGATAGWRTVLVGTLRLGGRGVYALDITNPQASSESLAGRKLLWEFNNTSPGGANLGYTYASANIIRIKHRNKWVVVVASGYFPTDGLDSGDPAALANQSSLFVLDLETGALIRELRTPAGVTSFGLSTPGAMDVGNDNVVDVVMAGDLAGNLWRFDLSNENPAAWKIAQFFKTYATAADIGKQPITVMPVVMRSGPKETPRPIWVFGTGKFLGDTDRKTTSYPTQYFYGVRDVADAAGAPGSYPMMPASLTSQTIQDQGNFRGLSANPVPDTSNGWKIALDQKVGERNVVIPFPLYASNLAVLSTVIPGLSDPCVASREGEFMIVDAASGGASSDVVVPGAPASIGGNLVAGLHVDNPPRRIQATTKMGGGTITLPQLGVTVGASVTNPIEVRAPNWQRKSWRELLNSYELDR